MCEHCNGKLNKYESSIEDGSFMRINPNRKVTTEVTETFPEIYVLIKGEWHSYFDINFCPICGTKLKIQ